MENRIISLAAAIVPVVAIIIITAGLGAVLSVVGAQSAMLALDMASDVVYSYTWHSAIGGFAFWGILTTAASWQTLREECK